MHNRIPTNLPTILATLSPYLHGNYRTYPILFGVAILRCKVSTRLSMLPSMLLSALLGKPVFIVRLAGQVNDDFFLSTLLSTLPIELRNEIYVSYGAIALE